MRVPVSTPGGILISKVRRVRTRPSPAHSAQGCLITVPKPRHVVQGRAVMTWPRNERWTCWISPRPLQVSQVTGCVPGAVPSPWHVGADDGGVDLQLACRRRTPPRRGRPRSGSGRPGRADVAVAGPRCSGAPPKKASMMSVKENPAPRRRRAAAAVAERVTAEVVHLALLGVRQHLVGRGDLLEALLRLGVRVDVGVQLPGQPAVGLLDLVGRRRLAADAEECVVVTGRLVGGISSPPGSRPT